MPAATLDPAHLHDGRRLGWACGLVFFSFILVGIAVAWTWTTLSRHRTALIVRPVTVVDEESWSLIVEDACDSLTTDGSLRQAVAAVTPADVVLRRELLATVREGISIQRSGPPIGPYEIKLQYEGCSRWGSPLIVELAGHYVAVGAARLAQRYAARRDHWQSELTLARADEERLMSKADELGFDAETIQNAVRRTRLARVKLEDLPTFDATTTGAVLRYHRRKAGQRLLDVLDDRSEVLSQLCQLRGRIQQIESRRGAASETHHRLASIRLAAEPAKYSVNLTASAKVATSVALLSFSMLLVVKTNGGSWTEKKIRTAADAADALQAPVLALKARSLRTAWQGMLLEMM